MKIPVLCIRTAKIMKESLIHSLQLTFIPNILLRCMLLVTNDSSPLSECTVCTVHPGYRYLRLLT